jgi:DNA-binding LacI/PurR family transcriptional regulator
MVRLKDIAERIGVSVMTVSKALRDEPDVSAATKARIKSLAQEMCYVPDSSAQGLRNRTTKLLGLSVSSLTNPIFSRVVMAIEEHAYELGYELLLAHTLNTPEREEACLRRFLSRRVDGLFISPVYRMGTEARIYQELLARRIPTVVLGHTAPFCGQFMSVATDDLPASYAITQHLLKLGHKRIAFLAGPLVTPWNQERFEGYRRALSDAGIGVDDKLVFHAGRTIEDGAKAAAQMISESTDASAVQAVNDLVAVGCADAFLNRGLAIPGDISVAGFGNTTLGEYFRVPLTSTRQPRYRLGLAAMEAMQQLLRGHRPESKRLPAELVPRQSTGTAPATSPLKRLKSLAWPERRAPALRDQRPE